MKINIHVTFLPHTDAEASLAFYRDVLEFEVRNDVGYGDMRWLTVGPPAQPDTSIVLTPPAVDPGLTDDEKRVIHELIAKGSYASVVFATDDLDGLFARVEASAVEVLQEPMAQDWGTRDFAFRDPAGNTVRVQEL
ncbi:VOC family protein [Leucobacter chromiireducens]|uniref:VOC family protein n=1 Tax=Leucobacter chromiireducens TaxID=283877 RepID=UPI000F6326C7|nr:VOC family protein [Leucobacter chromiireducens]